MNRPIRKTPRLRRLSGGLLLALALLVGAVGCASTPTPAREVVVDTRPLPFPAENAADSLWGYQTTDGSWELPPRYQVALNFTLGGIAGVTDRDGWRFIDRRGATVVPRPWIVENYPDPFHEGVARCVADDGIAFFDESGRVVLSTRFAYAESFTEGLALVCDGCVPQREGEYVRWVGGRWGFIDHAGQVVIPCRYDEASTFDEGVARVKVNGEWRSIDRTGREVAEE
jgi:hypothetical protein